VAELQRQARIAGQGLRAERREQGNQPVVDQVQGGLQEAQRRGRGLGVARGSLGSARRASDSRSRKWLGELADPG
jgi:hypothetical protein